MKKRKNNLKKSKLDDDLNDKIEIYDSSESEEEFDDEERHLIQTRKGQKVIPEEEEVFRICSSSEDEEESVVDEYDEKLGSDFDSDIDRKYDSDTDLRLPSDKAWGKLKQKYYNTDYVDKDFGGFTKDEEEIALMEEEEANVIQKRMIDQLDSADFTFGLLNKVKENKKLHFSNKITEELKTEKIQTDLTGLNKQEKLQLLKRKSPELFQLIDDFQEKFEFAKSKLYPVLHQVKCGTLKESPIIDFIRKNCNLIINYSTNITFFILLKSKWIDIDNHPVIKRLITFKKLIEEMERISEDISLEEQIDHLMEKLLNNEPLKLIEKFPIQVEKKYEKVKKKLKILDKKKNSTSTADQESQILESKKVKFANEKNIMYDELSLDEDEDNENVVGEEDELAESINKRSITYEMQKNKGLTPKRKKENRNPRVKHRNKYKKALKRRKGQVQTVRRETERYGGEISGIKVNVTKSIKLK